MGGTIDPKTGEVTWTLHRPVDDQLAYYRAHPPRALASLRATPIEIALTFDGHGEPVNAIFELACPCGGTQFTVSGGLDNDDEIRDPIELECDACEVVHEIFDSSIHGYDGERMDTPPAYPDDYNELVAPDIDSPHEIVVRFEYGSEELDNPDGDAAWRGREQDLFTWFTLLARHAETKEIAFLYDSECA